MKYHEVNGGWTPRDEKLGGVAGMFRRFVPVEP